MAYQNQHYADDDHDDRHADRDGSEAEAIPSESVVGVLVEDEWEVLSFACQLTQRGDSIFIATVGGAGVC